MTKNYYKDLYQTKDSEIATILYSMKQVLDTTFWENGSCFFVFANKDKCEKIISDYLNDKITIGAKSLMESVRTIKSIVKGAF
ncbi:MAG: DUF5659 domain-containing protein [Candidatus Falkowbacteria bacterium]|nr:DUF5659 domain-containing protein [Candidatus Falkowbacteria bacterium]